MHAREAVLEESDQGLRRESVSPASTHSYAGSPEKVALSSSGNGKFHYVPQQQAHHSKMMVNLPSHLGLIATQRTPSPSTVNHYSSSTISPSNQQSVMDLRRSAFTHVQPHSYPLLNSPKKLVIDEAASQEDKMISSPHHQSDSDYHSSHRDSTSSPGADSSHSEHSDSGNLTADLSGVRNQSTSSSEESDKISPNSGLSSAQKRFRNTSPNLNKIEEVINNLTSSRNKRKEKRSSPTQDVEASVHLSKKFKYNSFPSAPTSAHSGLPVGVPLGIPAMSLPVGLPGYPYPMASQAGVGLSLPILPPLQVTPPPAAVDSSSNLSTLALAATGELSRGAYGPAQGNRSHDSDANSSNSSSPLNLSGGFHISSTPSSSVTHPKTAPPSAKCVRSLLKTEDEQPINLTVRSPASDYSSGRGSRDCSPTPEPPFSKPMPNKEDAKQLKEEMNEQHSKLYTKLKASASSATLHMSQQYMSDVDALETDRFRALAANVASQQLKEAIHIYYDKERKLLCRKVQEKYEANIEEESANVKKEPVETVSSKSPLEAMQQMTQNVTMAQTLANMAAMHKGFSGHLPPGGMGFPAGLPHPGLFPGFPGAGFPGAGLPGALPGLPFPSGLPTPAHFLAGSELNTPRPEKQQAQQNFSTSVDPSTESGDDSFSSGNLKRKFLTPSAIEVLSDWYETNKAHPYPDEATVEELAQKANVTCNQVKKWMANKRVRSCNTLAHNGSVHPKKLEKLMQLRELSQIMPSTDESSPASSFSTTTTGDSGSGRRSKRMLPAKAVETLNKWYFEHLSYPYPTEEEKAELAREGGLLISQVTCWFANKRNRSHNTKKVKQQIFEYMSQKRDQDSSSPASNQQQSPTHSQDFKPMFPVAMEMTL